MTTKKQSFAEVLKEVENDTLAELRSATKSTLITILKESERRAGWIKNRKAELTELDKIKNTLMKAYEASDLEAVREVTADVARFCNKGQNSVGGHITVNVTSGTGLDF